MQTMDAIVRFGTFEIDLRSGELRKGGVHIALQEQPRVLLLALLEHPGEIVAREDLCARLWPEGTFVDFEHSLNAAVRRLRLALGDHAEIPRFIETVHKRGYRFLALRDVLTPASLPATSPATIAHIVRKRLRLAVLPFGPGDMFTNGLTEDAVTQLTQSCPCTIGVIARTSVAHAHRSGGSAAEIARKLSADYLVDGQVRRDGNRVRITAQLIESRAQTHLWADTFDRVLTNSLEVQTQVAEEIAQGVTAALTDAL